MLTISVVTLASFGAPTRTDSNNTKGLVLLMVTTSPTINTSQSPLGTMSKSKASL